MTLISSIITSAYRESNMLPLSKAPSANQVTEALNLFRTLYTSSFGSAIGYRLADWSVQSAAAIVDPSSFPADLTAGFTVFPNSRLLCKLAAATTLLLNPYPQDGEIFSAIDVGANFGANNLTLDANGRLIEGVSTKVLSVNGARGRWFYNASIGGWSAVLDSTTFLATADIGLPSDFDDYWIVMLAMRLSPRYGRALTDETKQRLTMMHDEIEARYSQTSIRDPNSTAVPEGVKEG